MSDLPETDAASHAETFSAELDKVTFTDETAPEAAAEPVETQPVAEAPSQGAEPAQAASGAPDGFVHVPLAKYTTERQRRQAAEARLAELERHFAQQQQAQTPSPQQAAAPAKAEEPAPDPEKDLAGYLLWANKQHAARLEAHEKELQDRVKAYDADVQRDQQARQQAHYVAQLDDAYRNHFLEHAQQNPAVLEAHEYFANRVVARAKARGRTDAQAQAALIQAQRELAYEAFTNELSPVELIVNIARADGWTPGQAKPAAAVQPQPGGAAPAPAAAPAADQAEKRRAAAKTLSAASGGAVPTSRMSDFANMSREEYAAYRKKHGNPLLAAG